MHVFIITQYFPPEIGAAATRWGEYSKILAEQNHKVTVLCESPHYPNSSYFSGYKNEWIKIERNERITIFRSKAFSSNRKTSLKKILHYLTFMFSAITNLSKVKNYDLLIVSSPPLFTGIIALYVKNFHKKEYWLDVRDLWPDSALELNQINRGMIYNISKYFEKKIYMNAKGFIFPVPGFKNYFSNFSKEIRKRPMIDLMNGVSKDFLKQAESISVNDTKTFSVLYSGNLGLAQDLNTILDAANLLKEYNIQFVFIGHGVCKEEVKKKAKALDEKIKFLDPMEREKLIKHIKQSSVCLVPLKKRKLFHTALPSKMFEYMACAKPVIVGIDGEAKKIVNDSKSGMCVQPENPEMLSKAILTYFNDKEKRRIDGENGFSYVTKNLQKEYLISSLMKEIKKNLD